MIRCAIVVRDGKGTKDRVKMLPGGPRFCAASAPRKGRSSVWRRAWALPRSA